MTQQEQQGNSEVLVDVKNLKMYFPVTSGIVFQRHVADIKAVDGVSFQVKRGETLGLVGESGCGKTTTGRCILQLYRPTEGQVFFEGIDLVLTKGRQLRAMPRHMQCVAADVMVMPRSCSCSIQSMVAAPSCTSPIL